MLGYRLPCILINNGTRLTTPSISGAVLITPTPSASKIGGNIPLYVNRLFDASLFPPTIFTGRNIPIDSLCELPVCAITTPLPISASNSSGSLPNRSGSLNNIGSTIIPAPCSRSVQIKSAILSLGHGH